MCGGNAKPIVENAALNQTKGASIFARPPLLLPTCRSVEQTVVERRWIGKKWELGLGVGNNLSRVQILLVTQHAMQQIIVVCTSLYIHMDKESNKNAASADCQFFDEPK